MTPAEKVAKAKPPWRGTGSKPARNGVAFKCHLKELRGQLRLSIRDVSDGVGLTPAGVQTVPCLLRRPMR